MLTNTVEAAKNNGKVSNDARTQRLLYFPSWQHGLPHLAHTRQSMGICWIKWRMNACPVTEPCARCDWYKNKWHSPCSQRIQPTGKERPKSHFNSIILYILFVAMLRPFGDTEWSLMENDTEEAELPCLLSVFKRDIKEYWKNRGNFHEKNGLWAGSQTISNIVFIPY